MPRQTSSVRTIQEVFRGVRCVTWAVLAMLGVPQASALLSRRSAVNAQLAATVGHVDRSFPPAFAGPSTTAPAQKSQAAPVKSASPDSAPAESGNPTTTRVAPTTVTVSLKAPDGSKTNMSIATVTLLACIRGPWNGRAQESSGNYGAVSPNGLYFGAYQFSRPTWDWIAGMYLPALVGKNPAEVSPALQDQMAAALAHTVKAAGFLVQWPNRQNCLQFVGPALGPS